MAKPKPKAHLVLVETDYDAEALRLIEKLRKFIFVEPNIVQTFRVFQDLLRLRKNLSPDIRHKVETEGLEYAEMLVKRGAL